MFLLLRSLLIPPYRKATVMKRHVTFLVTCGLVILLGLPSVSPGQGKSASAKPKSPEEKTQEVVGEGVGRTADEALKDAFRNAVRLVVGAVVDAETLVKNDELIDDKVLTYSDGFIKGYDEVAGSKKAQGGLHRIKIKAQVERRSVIAKLKAANITVKEVDGKGLFAEAVTQLDAEKDASALLKKQFEGFPQSCITATIIGTPELVEKNREQAKVKITVQIEPDLKAYKAFSIKLISILAKLAKSKGEFTAKFGKHPEDETPGLNAIGDGGYGNNQTERLMPKLFENRWHWKKGQVSVAVATNRTKAAESIDYTYFVLDPSLESELRAVLLRGGHCKLQLLDADGEVVATDRFEPMARLYPQGPYIDASLVVGEGQPNENNNERVMLRGNDPKERLCLLYVSPVFGDLQTLTTTLTIPRILNLSLDELKSVKDAKCEITFAE